MKRNREHFTKINRAYTAEFCKNTKIMTCVKFNIEITQAKNVLYTV